MKSIRLLTALVMGLGLTLVVTLLASAGRDGPPARQIMAPGNPTLQPAANSHTAPATATVSITYDEAIDPTTVSTRTFAVHAMQTGLLTRTYSVVGGAIRLTPPHPFHPGELVGASATTGTLNLIGEAPLAPTVWQFRVAVEDGTGVFSDSFQHLGSDFARAVALGDLDGDGDLDAFFGNQGEPNTVWLNDGTGVMVDSGQSMGMLATFAAALGDLDGDADLDAFVGNGGYFAEANQVWLNDGAGGMSDSGQTLGVTRTLAVALGDLDGDADLDALVGNNIDYNYICLPDPCAIGGTNQVWLNQGDGTFVDSGQTLDVGSDTQAAALGDLDGDGDLDALVGNRAVQWGSGGWTGGETGVWLNDGAGVLSDSLQTLAKADTVAVALGDLDSDGDLDALIGNSGQASKVWLNDGAGGFSDSGQSLGVVFVSGAILGDVDGDGDLDAVFSSDGAPNAVWLNDGSGTLTDSGRNVALGRVETLALGDVDSDGDLDLVVGATGETVPDSVWLNNKNAPLAVDDGLTVPPNSSANLLNVLANDSDPDGDALTIVALGTPDQGGMAAIQGTTLISYTPLSGYVGLDVFTYTVADPGHLTAAATVTVTVGGVNHRPLAQDDNATTDEDTPITIAVMANDSDPDGQIPYLIAVGSPLSGTAVIAGGAIDYAPFAQLYGVDTFSYTLSDGWLTDTATVTVTVNAVEDPPTLDPVAEPSIDEDSGPQMLALSGISSGAFNELQTLTVTAQTLVNSDIVPDPTVIYTSPAAVGQLAYAPAADAFGNAYVRLSVSDGVLTTTREFWIAVQSVNDPPTIGPRPDWAIDEDAGPQSILVSGISGGPVNEGQNHSLAVTAATTNTALVPDLTLTYSSTFYWRATLDFTPPADAYGAAGMAITVSDGLSQTVGTFQVIVNPINDPPTLDPVGDHVMDEDSGPQAVGLSGIGSGAANEPQTLTVTAAATDTALIPSVGISYVSPNPTGQLSLDPAADRFGTTTVLVTVTDGISATRQAFTVTVQPVNDPPTLDAIPDLLIAENSGQHLVALNGISAGPFESQAVTLTAVSDNPGLIPDPTISYAGPQPTGTLYLTPADNQFGAASIVVTVTDGALGTARVFEVTVAERFRVHTTSPAGNGGVVPRSGPVSATFSQPPNNGTINLTTFRVGGRQTGAYGGSIAYNPLRFTPTQPFKPGEELTAWLYDDIQSSLGESLIPHTWGFRAAVGGGNGIFVDSGQALNPPATGLWRLVPQSARDTQAVLLADLNGDGDLDALLIGNSVPSTVWFNDGNGAYSDSGQRPGGGLSWAAALGDLDGDGDLDALVGNVGAGDSIWLNDGAGHLSDSGQVLGFWDTFAVALGDLDADGDLDAVVATDQGQPNRVWWNDGAGVFTPGGQSLGYWEARAVALGDLDGDGDLDLLWGISDSRPNQVWLNQGNRQLGLPGQFGDSGQRLGAGDTAAVALGDVDGDGDLDAWFGNLNGQPDEIWLNNGAGQFSDSGQRLGSSATWAVALGDLDADGDLDGCVGTVRHADLGYQANQVWFNNGTGVFSSDANPFHALGSWDTLALALGDVDGDGSLDALVGNSSGLSQPNQVYLNGPHPPLAADDATSLLAGSDGLVPALANDVDPEGGDLWLVGVTAPAHGTAAVVGSAVAYTPTAGYTGLDSLSYTVSDSDGMTQSAEVVVQVVAWLESTMIDAGQGGSLSHMDQAGWTTQVTMAEDSVAEPTEIRLIPLLETGQPVGDLSPVGPGFVLQAYRQGSLVAGLILSRPMTITIAYDEAVVEGWDEATLALLRWSPSSMAWSSDLVRLVGRDPAANRLILETTYLGLFALYAQAGQTGRPIYLPLMLAGSGGGWVRAGPAFDSGQPSLDETGEAGLWQRWSWQ